MSAIDRRRVVATPAQLAALSDAAAAERYQRRQREIRRGKGRDDERPGPQEYDRSGFPIPQSRPSFVKRVARLLSPI